MVRKNILHFAYITVPIYKTKIYFILVSGFPDALDIHTLKQFSDHN